jgi:hypothetical protein
MKLILAAVLLACGVVQVSALTIHEVMSNPTGDDSGREWIEVYNEGSADIDISSMTISIKGGTAVVTTPLQGGTTLAPNGYAIIGSTVSGQTKFLQDYPNYTGLLFRSSISLVNTGVTSIDIKLNGSIVASVASYTAAKEGFTLSYLGGSYVTGSPTPGADNQIADTGTDTNTGNATTTETQVTLPQMSPPSADIMIYLPTEKVVVAGAEADFSVFSQTRAGKPINDLRYVWAFGDGGQSTGSSTKYRYVYNGRYIVQVEATNASVAGTGRMVVRVVPPDIAISSVGSGKYGSYIELSNQNAYDLDLSQWTLTIEGAGYPFPKNTLLPAGVTTRFSGLAMGFASSTLATSTVIKIRFPNLEDVTQYVPREEQVFTATSVPATPASAPVRFAARPAQKIVLGVSTSTQAQATSSVQGKARTRDTRLVSWLRSLFSWK